MNRTWHRSEHVLSNTEELCKARAVASHGKEANSNWGELPAHECKRLTRKRLLITHVGKNMEKPKLRQANGRDIKQCHCLETWLVIRYGNLGLSKPSYKHFPRKMESV